MKTNNVFFGIDEVSSELNRDFDKGLKNEYISYFAHLFHAKVMRVWLKTYELFKVAENDELIFLMDGLNNFHDYLYSLRKNGIDKILLLNWGFVYPYGYNAHDCFTCPDPINEPAFYQRFIALQEKVFYEIARNFPEIAFFEPINEPDSIECLNLHRNGYVVGRGNNEEYYYSKDERENIVLDLCFYEGRGVKKAYANNKIVFPGFCNYVDAPKYLDDIYSKIESGNFPSIGNIKSNKITDYFDIMSWHPYNLKDSEINDYWLETQNTLFNVMIKHGDSSRKVWYTEIGWSDFGRITSLEKIKRRYNDLMNYIDKVQPFVECVMFFRMFNLATRCENEGEDNFGLFYNAHDWETPLAPKPSAITLYKRINGENASLEPLYKYAKNRERILFPKKVFNKTKNAYKVLFLGNSITYQESAENNHWRIARGLGSSSINNDYVHLFLDEIGKEKSNIQYTIVDLRNFEKTFFADDILNELFNLDLDKPDLVIVNIGDYVGRCAFADTSFARYFERLIKHFASSKMIVTSSFSGFDEINESIEEVCQNSNIPFVDISSIKNGSDCLLINKIINNEIKTLPNDIGHQKIAKAIINKYKELSYEKN